MEKAPTPDSHSQTANLDSPATPISKRSRATPDSSFREFCVRYLSPLPGQVASQAVSPIGAMGNSQELSRPQSPAAPWKSYLLSPSTPLDDRAQLFIKRPRHRRCVQRLNFSSLPTPSVFFKANLLSVQISMELEDAQSSSGHQTRKEKKHKKAVSQIDMRPAGGKPGRICCNCQKSRCLKLYCDCFAAGEYCDGCNCFNCANLLENEEEREKAIACTLDRNPQAFKPKIDKVVSDTDGKHSKGCNCKKSACLKKYCECFQSMVKCGDLCKCIGCKNTEEEEPRKKTPKLRGIASKLF